MIIKSNKPLTTGEDRETRVLIISDGEENRKRIVGNLTPDYLFTQEEIDKHFKDGEVADYAETRRLSYLPLEEQMDLIYWDKVNGTNKWVDHIAKVKEDYPKN